MLEAVGMLRQHLYHVAWAAAEADEDLHALPQVGKELLDEVDRWVVSEVVRSSHYFDEEAHNSQRPFIFITPGSGIPMLLNLRLWSSNTFPQFAKWGCTGALKAMVISMVTMKWR